MQVAKDLLTMPCSLRNRCSKSSRTPMNVSFNFAGIFKRGSPAKSGGNGTRLKNLHACMVNRYTRLEQNKNAFASYVLQYWK